MFHRPSWLCLLLAASAPFLCRAVSADDGSPSPPPAPPLRQIDADVFEIGKVRLDKKQRTVTFPATLNMTDGALEYAIVGAEGKTHESLLRTDTQPYHLHLAMLLLGSKTAGETKPEPARDAQKPPDIIDSTYLATAPKLTGDDIRVEIAYQMDGKTRRQPLEDMIWDANGKRAVSRGPWLYSGSLFYEGKFCAQEDKSIAALITDPCALINNPREGAESEAVWVVRPQDVPLEGTPVTVTLKLPPTSEKPPATKSK